MSRKPLLSYFSEKELEAILEESFKVLENTGIYCPNKKAKDLLRNAGAKEPIKDNLTLSKELVLDVLENHHNPRFKLFNQTGDKFLQLEIGNTFYGPGSDLQCIIDLKTDKIRPTQLKDVATNISVVDSLDSFDFLMSTGLPCDVSPQELYAEVFKTMTLNSDKPIVATATTVEDIEKIHEIALKITGGKNSFKLKPFYTAYLEPVSPLKIESDIAEKVMFCAKNNIPLLFAAGANISVQAPGTPEGAVIQGTAESLSGLVLAYLTNPEVKFIFGANSADFDGNKGIVSYGGPGWSKTMAYYAEIAKKLNLPVWGAAGCTDSNRLDAQAGMEKTLSLLTAELCGSTLIHDVGYLGHGNLADTRAYVFDSEIIKRVKWMANRGLIIPGEVSPIIEDVSKGKLGTFLDAEHTFENYDARCHPEEWIDRDNHDEKRISLSKRLKKEVYKILKKHPIVLEEKVKCKRDNKETLKEVIKVKKEPQTLIEVFQDDPNNDDKVRKILNQRLEIGEKPEELYADLVNVLTESIKDADLVFQLAYGRLFDKVSDVVLSKMGYNKEGHPLVLASVEGDVHYVGKNLVAQLTSLTGYKIIDKGIDVSTGRLILSTLDNDACLIGLSSLLTTTRDNMKKTIKGLKELGMKDQVGIIIGGAVVDDLYAENINADAYRKTADKAGEALDSIKENFIRSYERKNISLEDFLVIGESINSISTKVRLAIENRDEEHIIKLAASQIKKGARYIDVAVSHLGDIEKQKQAVQWIVQTIQKEFDAPICFDSDDYRVIQAGLEVYDSQKGIPLINSTTLEKKRMENMVQLSVDYNSNLVFQAADGKNLELKVGMVDKFLEYTSTKGLTNNRVFVDPGLETTAHQPQSAKLALQTISTLKDKYPELQYIVGLTNIGYGLCSDTSRTKALQQAFLLLGKRVGLNSAITNPSIVEASFNEREKALADSMEFIIGFKDNIAYAKALENQAYDLLK